MGDFRMVFEREVLAQALWEYGEDDLADRAMTLGDRELHAIQELAARRHQHDPEPPAGPRLTHGRVIARAMIEWAEGAPRDTTRSRRRTRPASEKFALPD